MTSTGNGPKISSYSWQFGEPLPPAKDTSSLKNPSHLYKAPGTYNVKLVAENTIGCKDSIQKQVIVFALPEANYEYSLSCAGEKTAFTDISIPALAPIIKWDWTFNDDGGVLGRDDIPNPEFVFPNAGKYIVNLMVSDTNGCYDTTNIPVTTWSVPVSVFSYTDNFSDIQGFLSFVNTSIDAVKYYWTFGNGDDSYIDNPTEFYENDGTYQIQLITWNEKQCTDTLNVEYTLLVKGLFIPNAFSPSNPKESVRLLKPVGINLMEYKFEVFDRWGNMLWKTDKLDLAGRPVEGWDGTYNGKPMPEGVYTWRATGVFRDGTVWEAENLGNSDGLTKAKSGTATMIR
jgi:gliding motility-associated-like protein